MARTSRAVLAFAFFFALGAQGTRNVEGEEDSGRLALEAFAAQTASVNETAVTAAAVKAPHRDLVWKLQPAAAEFLAMLLFVVIGCGSAMGIAKDEGAAWILQVSMTFGLAITSLAYAVGHISGGHINCAVTFALFLQGEITFGQCMANIVAQLLGSVAGALLLCGMYPKGKDKTGGLGSNGVGEGWSYVNAFLGEVLMTFLLVFVVLETAVDAGTVFNRAQACIAIGFAVFLAHSVLIPIDGCSINPTRSTGPALIARLVNGASTLGDLWLFWVGPMTGSALGVGAYKALGAMAS